MVEGESLAIQMQASDSDGDFISYRAALIGDANGNLPTGAQFDRETGRLEWTPDFTQAGTYRIRMTATDGVGSRSEDVLIAVQQKNQPPVFSSSPALFRREGEQVFFTVTASDFDGEPLIYRLADISGDWTGIGLPDGMQFSPANRTLIWDTGFESAGDYILHFTAEDPAGAVDTLDVEVKILPVNRAPRLELPTLRNAQIGVPLELQVTATDPDDDQVSLSV